MGLPGPRQPCQPMVCACMHVQMCVQMCMHLVCISCACMCTYAATRTGMTTRWLTDKGYMGPRGGEHEGSHGGHGW